MIDAFEQEVLATWIKGGPVMLALAALALVIYGSVLQTLFYLGRLRQLRKDPDRWGHWIEKPSEGSGLLGDMIRYVQRDIASEEDLRLRFRLLRQRLLEPLDRQLRFVATVVAAAPLLGLLGTVIGMLATFLGLSISYGGNTLDLVAGGISEALITTQTGLILAIPAMFCVAVARSRRRGVDHFLTELEIRTARVVERRRPAPARPHAAPAP